MVTAHELKWLLCVQSVAEAYGHRHGRGDEWVASVIALAPPAPRLLMDFGSAARIYVRDEAGEGDRG